MRRPWIYGGLAAVLLTGAFLREGGMIALRPTLAYAQSRPAQQRVVEGRVVSKADAPLPGAVVYLKDTRTLSVKSYLSDEGGHFHFGQLADGADYELWAEQTGKRSSSKSISQFNSKRDLEFTLKIDTEK